MWASAGAVRDGVKGVRVVAGVVEQGAGAGAGTGQRRQEGVAGRKYNNIAYRLQNSLHILANNRSYALFWIHRDASRARSWRPQFGILGIRVTARPAPIPPPPPDVYAVLRDLLACLRVCPQRRCGRGAHCAAISRPSRLIAAPSVPLTPSHTRRKTYNSQKCLPRSPLASPLDLPVYSHFTSPRPASPRYRAPISTTPPSRACPRSLHRR